MANEEISKKEKVAARILLKYFRCKHYQLPSSFDECLGYLTGYRDSSLHIRTFAEMVHLTKQCANYAANEGNLGSLQLVMYAFMRRSFRDNKYILFISDKETSIDFSNLIYIIQRIIGDVFSLYENDVKSKAKDIAEVFTLFLALIEKRYPIGILKYAYTGPLRNINKKDIPELPTFKRETLPHESGLAVEKWENKFEVNSAEYDQGHGCDERFKQGLSPFEDGTYYVSRGGGLWHFIDHIKDVALDEQLDDSRQISGMYWTPAGASTRDEFYAFRIGNALTFFDLPTQFAGTIKSDYLLSTNFNSYEVFIKNGATTSFTCGPKVHVYDLKAEKKQRNLGSISTEAVENLILPKLSSTGCKRRVYLMQILYDVTSIRQDASVLPDEFYELFGPYLSGEPLAPHISNAFQAAFAAILSLKEKRFVSKSHIETITSSLRDELNCHSQSRAKELHLG